MRLLLLNIGSEKIAESVLDDYKKVMGSAVRSRKMKAWQWEL